MDVDKEKVKKSTREFRLETLKEEELLFRRMMSKVVRDNPDYSNLEGPDAQKLIYMVIELNSGLLPNMYKGMVKEQAESTTSQDKTSI